MTVRFEEMQSKDYRSAVDALKRLDWAEDAFGEAIRDEWLDLWKGKGYTKVEGALGCPLELVGRHTYEAHRFDPRSVRG